MTRLRHFDDLGAARFITFSCYYRLPSLNQPGAKEFLIEELDRSRAKHGFLIWGYVLMPEHVHIVLYPPDGTKLGLVIREIKSRSAKRYFSAQPTAELWGTKASSRPTAERRGTTAASSEVRRVFWQRRCYDHNCRTAESVWEKINYCHNNPVKRGLVSEPSAWAWSSYNWYQGHVDVPIRIDKLSA